MPAGRRNVAAELALPEVDFTSKTKRKQSKLCGYKDKAKNKQDYHAF